MVHVETLGDMDPQTRPLAFSIQDLTHVHVPTGCDNGPPVLQCFHKRQNFSFLAGGVFQMPIAPQ